MQLWLTEALQVSLRQSQQTAETVDPVNKITPACQE